MTDYTPIACALHDHLEHHAVRGATVEVVWRGPEAEHTQTDRVADVFARDGADWIRLGDGTEVRADRIVSVDGVGFGAACRTPRPA
ncbi:MAG: hypothetical protein AAF594_11935 [Bacteroidota bacterium]